jgi:5-hydroxyisourate hydrolase-like protein (transthyretin family)
LARSQPSRVEIFGSPAAGVVIDLAQLETTQLQNIQKAITEQLRLRRFNS